MLATFSTKEDWIPCLTRLEMEICPVFVEYKHYSTGNIPIYSKLSNIKDIGMSLHGNTLLEKMFFIYPEKSKIDSLRIDRNDGVDCFTPIVHGDAGCVCIKFGGEYLGHSVIIQGELYCSTSGKDIPPADIVFCSRAIDSLTQSFKYKNGFYFGSNAIRLFQSGYRLTKNFKMSKEFDVFP